MNKSARMLFFTQAVLASSIVMTSFAAKATTFGPGIFLGPITTAAQPDNTVEVLGGTASGIIVDPDASAGVILNSTGGIVITRTQNQINTVDTITSSNGIGLNITGAEGVVSIEFDSGVSSLNGEAIQISATDAEITNAGNITVTSQGLSAIEVNAGGSNATVNNLFTGVISNRLPATLQLIRVNQGAPGFTLNNEGRISSNNFFDTILLLSPFTAINNELGGVISHNGVGAPGSLIRTALGATAGDIINHGRMILTDPASVGNVILLNPVTLSTSGNIINTGNMISQHGSTIFLSTSMTSTLPNINNSGTLYGANVDAGNAVIFNALAGAVLSGGILNTGNIILDPISTSPNAIDLQTNPASATFTQNGGAVLGNVLLAPFDSNGSGKTFIMNGGSIEGNVFAGAVIANTLTLAGGDIVGTVFLGPFGDTVNLSGTTLFRLIGGIGADRVNITGGDITTLMDLGAGLNVVNIGGLFPGQPETLFTQNGIFQATGGVLFINVNGVGTVYTINNDIFDVAVFRNNEGATTILNPLIVFAPGGGDYLNFGTTLVPTGKNEVIDFSADAGGQFLNFGTLILDPNSTLTLDAPLAGTVALFFNEEGAFFDPQIGGIAVPGGTTAGSTLILNDIALGSALLDFGSFVEPTVSGFIPDGETFTIITVNPQVGGGTIIDNSTLIQPASAVVFFTKELDAEADDLLLTTHRHTFSSFVEGDGDEGIAALLDLFAFNPGLITDQNLLNLLIQLDSIATVEGVDEALDSLAPDVSGAKYFSATWGMNNVFQAVFDRTPAFGKAFSYDLADQRKRKKQKGRQKQSQFDAFTSTIKVAENGGINFGDPLGAWAGWGRIYTGHLNGHQDSDSQGFKAKGLGAVIGVDYVINQCSILGSAISYTKVDADGNDVNPKNVDTKSWQITLYGLFEFQYDMFMDAMIGWAHNKFEGNRIISVSEINTSAAADFDGTLWGAQADLGWRAIYCPNYYFAPFARLKYTQLHVDGYTESGADFLNLSVDSDTIREWLGGLGFKVGTGSICRNNIVWIPELILMWGFDFNHDHEEVAAAFIDIGGTPLFDTVGASLGRGMFDLGLALHTRVGKNRMFTAKYDLQVSNHFTSNALHLQFIWVC